MPKVPSYKTQFQDVDPRAFEILISFMCGDAVRFQSVPTALNVIYAAKKYMVRKIDDLALKFIYKNINAHNVLLVLQNVLMLQEEPDVLPSAPSLALLEQVRIQTIHGSKTLLAPLRSKNCCCRKRTCAVARRSRKLDCLAR